MPYINTKVSIPLDSEKKQLLKEKLGQAIACIPGKSEDWLMLEFEDQCCLYFKGNQDGPTAFIEVKIFGSAPKAAYDHMTEKLCNLYYEELGIPQNRIYVKYEEVKVWGWNGCNF